MSEREKACYTNSVVASNITVEVKAPCFNCTSTLTATESNPVTSNG